MRNFKLRLGTESGYLLGASDRELCVQGIRFLRWADASISPSREGETLNLVCSAGSPQHSSTEREREFGDLIQISNSEANQPLAPGSVGPITWILFRGHKGKATSRREVGR